MSSDKNVIYMDFSKAARKLNEIKNYASLDFVSGRTLVIPLSSEESDRLHLMLQNITNFPCLNILQCPTGHILCLNLENLIAVDLFYELPSPVDRATMTNNPESQSDISDCAYISYANGKSLPLIDIEDDLDVELNLDKDDAISLNPNKSFIFQTWDMDYSDKFCLLDVGGGEYLHLNVSLVEFISFAPWHVNPKVDPYDSTS